MRPSWNILPPRYSHLPLQQALARLGCTLLAAVQPAQGVWLVRWHQRQVIAKVRDASRFRRLDKEADWLRQAQHLGIAAPHPLARLNGHGLSVLLMTRVRDHLPLSILARMRQLMPLHQLTPTQLGWGNLRADRQPRWRDPAQALQWYCQRCPAVRLNELVATWPQRQDGMIHGDVHRGNTCGKYLLDWEMVAIADPWEDLCRAILAQGWNTPPDWTAVDQDHPRWRGAWLRSCIESAAYGGPRQAAARQWLQRLPPR